MLGPIVSLKFLLLSCQLSERRGDHSDDDSGDEVPANGEERTFPTHQFRELAGEQNDVEDGLGEVQIQIS